jgi:glycosyltransferase involved in cell wall biosynthesis
MGARMEHTDPPSDLHPGSVGVSSGDGTGARPRDPAAGLAVLHVVDRVGVTNSQYNEHCLPVRATRRITVCSLFPAEVTVAEEIRLVEGDGSVRGCFRALRHARATGSYDVVHLHAPASGVLTMLVCLWARHPRRNLVFTAHSSWPVFRRRNRAFLVVIAAFFPVLVVCGQAAAESLPRLVRILARRIEVVSNGVDIDRVDRVLAEGSGRTRSQRGGLGVASIVRDRPIKDPATLVEAFLGAAGPRDSLVLVGAPGLPGDGSSSLHQEGLDSRIRLTGVVPREEVYRIFRGAALFVSTSKGEGLPVSVLEAMACRCPVVLSDIPPHRDIARVAPVIPLVPVGDVAGFREAIAQILHMTPSRRRVLRDEVRRCVQEHFGVTAMNDAYGRIYRGIAQHTGGPARAMPAGRALPRVVALSVLAAALGALAALGYGATHHAGYEATTTLAVGEVSAPPAEEEIGLGAADAATVADLANRQVVLGPVARALDLGDWRALQRRVHAVVAENPMYVDVTATETDPRAAERLSSAVAARVVRLASHGAGPGPDPDFADRELSRLGVDIADTQQRIDNVLQRMGSAGPPAVGPLGRRLAALRDRLTQLQESYQGMLTWRSGSGGSRGVSIEDVAYAQRPSWPPGPPALAALGAVGGLGALLGLRLLLGAGPAEDAARDRPAGRVAGEVAGRVTGRVTGRVVTR